jgi:hypothetical protein
VFKILRLLWQGRIKLDRLKLLGSAMANARPWL